MEVLIKAGAVVDVPTSGEVTQAISQAWRDQADAADRDRVRGVKWMRVVSAPATNKADGGGPQSGYVWVLLSVTAILSAGSDLCVFLGNQRDYSAAAGSPAASNLPLLGVAGSGQEAASNQLARISWGYREQIIYPDESITVVAQNGSANITRLLVVAVQIPQEKLGLLFT